MPNAEDFLDIFKGSNIRLLITIVILNIFLSYGLLYLSDYILNIYPSFNFSLKNIHFKSTIGLGLLATVIVSPIAEELIFRGVFLNKLKIIVPPIFAVLISSLMFASLHTYGSITAAFIFAICMAILYIKTDNILVPIFAHFLNNLIAETIFILDADKILFTNNMGIMIMSVLAIISFIMILIFIYEQVNNIK